eukprot:TRINITY_DN6896_c0_g1_i1.p1 TRINITY_DN6896_c0_g1~~TRINITY_DN6896_c0_g1_i1.p1  ORF type:complete len:372 (-),score=80.37 TRINITY_DN6896_c0_g1_i1:288-1403(-)
MIDFDRVEIIREIGRGGFSIVYEGKYQGVGVAIKKISEFDWEAFNDFSSEAYLLSQLNHPHVIKFIGMSVKPYCILTEFIPFSSLQSMLDDRRSSRSYLSFYSIARIAREICEGMIYLHSLNIIHRDLKPPNIFMCHLPPFPEDRSTVLCKIGDFGLSCKKISKMYSRKVDNFRWLAPEIMHGGTYTETSDIYSFAMVLWQLITLEIPFEEYAVRYKFLNQFEDAIIEKLLRPSLPSLLCGSCTCFAIFGKECEVNFQLDENIDELMVALLPGEPVSSFVGDERGERRSIEEMPKGSRKSAHLPFGLLTNKSSSTHKCPHIFYRHIIQRCWLDNPIKRPSFLKISRALDVLLDMFEKCKSLAKGTHNPFLI